MEFISEDVDAFSVELFADPRWNFTTKFTGERELDLYFIKNMILANNKTSAETVVYVEITFGRKLWSIIMNIYFITFLLSVVGHTSVFYDDQYFGDQIAMNVTIMLVQVTIYTAVS